LLCQQMACSKIAARRGGDTPRPPSPAPSSWAARVNAARAPRRRKETDAPAAQATESCTGCFGGFGSPGAFLIDRGERVVIRDRLGGGSCGDEVQIVEAVLCLQQRPDSPETPPAADDVAGNTREAIGCGRPDICLAQALPVGARHMIYTIREEEEEEEGEDDEVASEGSTPFGRDAGVLNSGDVAAV